MPHILPLRGAIKNYAWGSPTVLGEWLGRPSPNAEPEAELWLGAHPSGPSEVELEAGWQPLDSWLAQRAGSAPLPFLLKVLAVARPLSLQVHPDAAQARAGFARERGAPPAERRYVDPHPKPELVCALSRFVALCGFRPADEVAERLAALGLGDLFPDRGDDASRLAAFLGDWLAAPAAQAPALARARVAAREAAPRDEACAWLLRLDAAYPGDPGVLAPLFLHLLELAPGEALYLPPGELHCYLEGLAVELMGPSDNVLRGGLTPKPVYVDELLRVASFEPRRPPRLQPRERAPGEHVYPTPEVPFELSILEPGPGRPVEIAAQPHAELLWCATGALSIATHGPDGAPERLLRTQGEAALVVADAGGYRVEGEGRAFRAALPPAPAR
jgi:mannose-6-phosphate isomerase